MSGSGVLEGRAAIVTGAGRGLGRAYAMAAAREGAAIVVNDVSEQADAVADEIRAFGGRAVACRESVADWRGAEAIVAACRDEFGRVDGLVNNAGLVRGGQAWEQTEESARSLVEVNLLGSIFVGSVAMRTMMEQRSGAIVNMTSSAQMGVPNMSTYCATKGALASLTYAWAIDLEPYGVRVNGFAPSANTKRGPDDAHNSLNAKSPTPEYNAPAVVYLLSDLSAGINGQVIQTRGQDLVVISHPELTAHLASSETWTARAIAERLDPVLRAHQQPVGFAPARVGSQ